MKPSLKIARAIAGKTQVHIWLQTGIGASRISLIENGHIAPRDGEREKIAAALGMQAGDIEWEMSHGKLT